MGKVVHTKWVEAFDMENDSNKVAAWFFDTAKEGMPHYIFKIDCYLVVYDTPVSIEQAHKDWNNHMSSIEVDE